ncbi:HAAS domain-containing protein [Oceanobacillus indicireducens]|uniref:HAAS transmembrane region domain-containing protein n=1 Tax=Oceanobacillus indicireducens TaxID=1004261 RepID=A0A917XYP2_9BACI|nr:hypothetical protein [Oceanobacillus indicireducens]GGN57295.1 hypothetical protein GCM10007971_18140 [Oceanobacillus indicireducens]
MKNKLGLSKESQIFIENLRVYLSSSRKNIDEIEEITNDLKIHLLEAERNGKPIEKVVVFILFAFAGFRYITNQSARKQTVVLAGMVLLLSALSFDLIYLNKVIASPIIHFGTIGSLIVAVFIILFFIVLVFWATK